jgi:hypothetical protein
MTPSPKLKLLTASVIAAILAISGGELAGVHTVRASEILRKDREYDQQDQTNQAMNQEQPQVLMNLNTNQNQSNLQSTTNLLKTNQSQNNNVNESLSQSQTVPLMQSDQLMEGEGKFDFRFYGFYACIRDIN